MPLAEGRRRTWQGTATGLILAGGLGLGAVLLRREGGGRVMALIGSGAWGLVPAGAVPVIVSGRAPLPSLSGFVAPRWPREGVFGAPSLAPWLAIERRSAQPDRRPACPSAPTSTPS